MKQLETHRAATEKYRDTLSGTVRRSALEIPKLRLKLSAGFAYLK